MATGPDGVDVVSPTAATGAAVRRLRDHLSITADRTMVFGDYLNDLEMMPTATSSFATAKAHPLLTERAACTAPANSEDGVVRTIRTVLGL